VNKNAILLIPVFNEEKVLKSVVTRYLKDTDVRILFVNDASTDNSLNILENFQDYRIEILTNEENKGQGYSLQKGVEYILSKYTDVDYIVTADSDGQHDPKDVQKIINECNGNNLVVKGIRKFSSIEYLSQRLSLMFGYLVFSGIFFHPINDPTCGLRAYHTSILSKVQFADRYDYLVESNRLYVSNRKRSKEIAIKAIYDEYTLSKGLNFRKSISFFFQVIKARVKGVNRQFRYEYK
jgi:glycosyltransferase involved in cell wall biosynthesis